MYSSERPLDAAPPPELPEDFPPEPLALVALMVCGIYSQNSRETVICSFFASALWENPLKSTLSMPCFAVSSLTMGMGCGTVWPGFRKMARTVSSAWYFVLVGVSSRMSSTVIFASS